MKAMILLCLAVAAALPALAADPPGDAKALEGVWKPATATLGGQPVPPALLGAITLKLHGGAYEVTIEGERTDKGTATIDSTVTPHRMSITGVEGPNQGKTFPAIYEIQDADTFRVCYDLSGKAFPTELKSTDGTQLYLVIYRRQKE